MLRLGILLLIHWRNFMATTTTISRAEPPSAAAQIVQGAYEVAVSAGAGALAGYMFTLINPVGGAVFGTTMALTRLIGSALADKFLMNQTAMKIMAWTLSLLAGVGAGFLAATGLGFAMTVSGAIGMTFAMILTSCAMRCMFTGAGCCAACLGGLGLAVRERV